MNSIPKTLTFLIGLLLIGGVVVANVILTAKENDRVGSKKTDSYAKEIAEPSGITYHPDKEALVVVGDEGQIATVSLEGEVLLLKNLGGDLEGVTADADHHALYAVDEKANEILVLDWETLDRVDTLSLEPVIREAGLSTDLNDGFEGIAYQPSEGAKPGILWLGHQRRPTVLIPLELEGDPPRVRTGVPIEVDLPEISGLCVDPKTDELWIACDKEDACFRVSTEGEIIEKRKIRGKNQEGIAILPNGDWWIADDSGGIFPVEGE
ncbi:MAG: SdiA-regulated domain-containing protein [Candidatus Omnitrophica bacterium]|nr:SdiA-regulated domain-containing protein [Candidatus Omnitrophota bacterium]